MLEPRTALAMTLHSMCHPGRPSPHGEGHDGSPALDDFHSAKSDGARFVPPVVNDPGPALSINAHSK